MFCWWTTQLFSHTLNLFKWTCPDYTKSEEWSSIRGMVRWWLRSWETCWPCRRLEFGSHTPSLDSSWAPVTPAAGHPVPSFDLSRHMYTCLHVHAHTCESYKSLKVKRSMKVSKIAQQVKVFAAKPDVLILSQSLVPTWLKERTDSHKLPSDFHMPVVAHMCPL